MVLLNSKEDKDKLLEILEEVHKSLLEDARMFPWKVAIKQAADRIKEVIKNYKKQNGFDNK